MRKANCNSQSKEVNLPLEAEISQFECSRNVFFCLPFRKQSQTFQKKYLLCTNFLHWTFALEISESSKSFKSSELAANQGEEALKEQLERFQFKRLSLIRRAFQWKVFIWKGYNVKLQCKRYKLIVKSSQCERGQLKLSSQLIRADLQI